MRRALLTVAGFALAAALGLTGAPDLAHATGTATPAADARERPAERAPAITLTASRLRAQPGRPAPRGPDCARVKCVALTFDDGPAASTPRLLDLLHQRRARATFFLLGRQVQAHPAITRRIAREGHVIGNHTWDHRDLTRLSRPRIRAEIVRTNRIVRTLTGQRPRLLRPPYGARNARVDAVARFWGMRVTLWTVDPRDWADRNAAVVTRRVLAAVRPGSIVLMHDIHPTTVTAVGRIVRRLRQRGYHLVSVPQLSGQRGA